MKKFKFIWKTGKKFVDKRGFLKKIIDGNFSSCIEVKSKKGSVRANHYHKKDKHFVYIISGEILYFYRNRKKGAQTKAYFTKNTHFLAFSTRKRTKFDYEKDLIRIDMRDYKIVKTAIKKFK